MVYGHVNVLWLSLVPIKALKYFGCFTISDLRTFLIRFTATLQQFVFAWILWDLLIAPIFLPKEIFQFQVFKTHKSCSSTGPLHWLTNSKFCIRIVNTNFELCFGLEKFIKVVYLSVYLMNESSPIVLIMLYAPLRIYMFSFWSADNC